MLGHDNKSAISNEHAKTLVNTQLNLTPHCLTAYEKEQRALSEFAIRGDSPAAMCGVFKSTRDSEILTHHCPFTACDM